MLSNTRRSLKIKMGYNWTSIQHCSKGSYKKKKKLLLKYFIKQRNCNLLFKDITTPSEFKKNETQNYSLYMNIHFRPYLELKMLSPSSTTNALDHLGNSRVCVFYCCFICRTMTITLIPGVLVNTVVLQFM